MSEVRLYTLAFVLMALSLPLISIGSINEIELLWIIGFVMLIFGALIPPAVRCTVKQPSATKE